MPYRCVPSAFPKAVLAEATRIAPGRRTSSDGICGDAAHLATGGDHVADSRGIPHAVDISQSTPGSPFWEPRYSQFDAHAYGWEIGRRMIAGTERRVKYLVSFNGQYDVILNPSVSPNWRINGSPKQDHANHLHVSFTVAAEQSTAPFFDVEAPVTAAEIAAVARATRDAIFADPRFDAKVRQAAEEAIGEKFSGFDERGKVGSLVIIRAREKLDVAPSAGQH